MSPAFALTAIWLLPLAASAAGTGPASGPVARAARFSEDTFLVKFQSAVTPGQIRRLAEAEGVEVLGEIPHISYHILRSPDHRALHMVRKFRTNPLVVAAHPDRIYRLVYEPNDPLWPDQVAHWIIHTPECWDTQKGDPDVIIAVLDTGIDYTHPDLAAHMWTNPGEIDGNKEDDDKNGFIDDYLGWDFAYNDNDPFDGHGHGTLCAGVAAAVGDNNEGVCGVAFNCTIMNVRIGLDSGLTYDSMFAPAIVYAADMGADAISMSYFTDDMTPLLREAIDYAWAKGVVPVAGAGNRGEIFPLYPAGYDNCISAAATTWEDSKVGFSNFGSWVDVAAPGVDILTTSRGGSYDWASGTSMSCPHVAALAGLIFSEYPGASNDFTRWRIERMSDDVAYGYLGEYMNYGRINAYSAVVEGLDDATYTMPKLRWTSPARAEPKSLVTIYGRCLKPRLGLPFRPTGSPLRPEVAHFAATPVVRFGGVRADVVRWHDDFAVVRVPDGAPVGDVEVTFRVGLHEANPMPFEVLPSGSPPTYAPTDVSNARFPPSGHQHLVYKRDGVVLAAPISGDKFGYVDALFLRLEPRGDDLTIHYTRTYRSVRLGVIEHVQLYNFDESYPYGSWDDIGSVPIESDVEGTFTWTVPGGIGAYLSYENAIFLKIYVPDLYDTGTVEIDELTLETP